MIQMYISASMQFIVINFHFSTHTDWMTIKILAKYSVFWFMCGESWYSVFSHIKVTSSRGRVVKALDLKSNGIFPRRFEPCRLRILFEWVVELHCTYITFLGNIGFLNHFLIFWHTNIIKMGVILYLRFANC